MGYEDFKRAQDAYFRDLEAEQRQIKEQTLRTDYNSPSHSSIHWKNRRFMPVLPSHWLF